MQIRFISTLEILDYNGILVTTWDWNSFKEMPKKGDTLLIRTEDTNNEEYRVNVLRREFDGTKPDVIRIVTDYVKPSKKIDETMLP